MKAKIDAPPYLTPEQGKALFNFFVDVIEAQRMRMKQLEFGGHVWGTVGQIAKIIGMSASGTSGLIERIRAAGFEVRQTNPSAISGHPMRTRYRIGDVQAGMYLLKSLNHVNKALKPTKDERNQD